MSFMVRVFARYFATPTGAKMVQVFIICVLFNGRCAGANVAAFSRLAGLRIAYLLIAAYFLKIYVLNLFVAKKQDDFSILFFRRCTPAPQETRLGAQASPVDGTLWPLLLCRVALRASRPFRVRLALRH